MLYPWRAREREKSYQYGSIFGSIGEPVSKTDRCNHPLVNANVNGAATMIFVRTRSLLIHCIIEGLPPWVTQGFRFLRGIELIDEKLLRA